jgi:hypothetical protein
VLGNEKSCCPTYEAASEPDFLECCSSAKTSQSKLMLNYFSNNYLETVFIPKWNITSLDYGAWSYILATELEKAEDAQA